MLINALASPSVWKLVGDSLAVAGYTLVAIIQKGIADSIRGIPGMEGAADTMDTAAVSSGMQAKIAQQGVQKDLKASDVTAAFAEAAKAARDVATAFKTAYANAGNPMDTAGPKGTLAGVVDRANARTDPKPIYYDNEGNAYGPGSDFGQPDSQMPKPGTLPPASSLGAGLAAMVRGALPDAAPDPGPGTIGGLPAASVVGNRPLTLPGPLRPLTLPIPNLNARAQGLVGASNPKPDPMLAVLSGTAAQILAFLQANKPTPAVAGTGIN